MKSIEWTEFSLKDLFSVKSSKKIFHANQVQILDFQGDNSFPYVVRSTQDNGIRGYLVQDKSFLNEGNTLSFAQDTFTVFFQKEAYFTGNKVKVLKPKFKKINDHIMLFFVSSFKKSLKKLSWGVGSTVESIMETKIKLPSKKGQIDFDFIEKIMIKTKNDSLTKIEEYFKNNK